MNSSQSWMAAAAFLVTSGASAQTAQPLAAQIAALTTEPAVVRAHWGVAVTSMNGTLIFGLNEGQYFRPASNAKLFTTAAAMHLLGPGTTVTTKVQASDPDADGTITGNLTIIGAADPNLSARILPYESSAAHTARLADEAARGIVSTPPDPLAAIDDLAAQVAAKGINEITGGVVGDDRSWVLEPYAESWDIGDMTWGYGAAVSSLSVNDNTIELVLQPAKKAGDPPTATFVPDIGFYQINMEATTVAEKPATPISIERAPGSHTVTVRGQILLGTPYTEELGVDDPALFAAQALTARLKAHGVTVDGEPSALHSPLLSGSASQGVRDPLPNLPMKSVAATGVLVTYKKDAPKTLAQRLSSPLAADVAVTLKVSQNLHAEMMLRRLGANYAGSGSFEQGSRVVRQFLLNAGIDGDDFVFYDGSGLSGHDLVTPRATAKLLAYAATEPWFETWKAALPVGGEDGSLASRFPKAPLKDHVFAKTGTLGESRALSGYVDCASGKTLIFSIMVDTHSPATGADRDVMDRIVAAIAAAN